MNRCRHQGHGADSHDHQPDQERPNNQFASCHQKIILFLHEYDYRFQQKISYLKHIDASRIPDVIGWLLPFDGACHLISRPSPRVLGRENLSFCVRKYAGTLPWL